MSRIKIQLPEQFSFTTKISIRITDLNYGGHVGNDTVLSLIHEARMQFLTHCGYTEMDMAGVGMIMVDASIEFRSELFYADEITASVAANDFTRSGFIFYYKLAKAGRVVAIAQTGMVCYDYGKKKLVSLPAGVADTLMHAKKSISD